MVERRINFHDQLEALYYFDPQRFTGSELKDRSGNERHLSASGSPVVESNGYRSFGQMTFDNDNDELRSSPVDFSYNGLTMACIFKMSEDVDQTDSNNFRTLLSVNDGSTVPFSLVLEEGNSINFSVELDGIRRGVRGGDIRPKNYFAVVGVHNPDRGVLQGYIDGELIVLNPNGSDTPDTSKLSNIAFGKGNDRGFRGSISFAGVWSRPLNIQEVDYITGLTGPRTGML